MYFKTVEKTALNISDLRHYASHSISVSACREMEKEERDLNDPNINTSNCSIKSIVTARTMKLGNRLIYYLNYNEPVAFCIT